MSIDFTEKAKRYQAIDEIIASGRKLKWNQIISELGEVYNIKTSRTSFFRDIEELQEKYLSINKNFPEFKRLNSRKKFFIKLNDKGQKDFFLFKI